MKQHTTEETKRHDTRRKKERKIEKKKREIERDATVVIHVMDLIC